MIIQKIREAEKDNIYQEFKDKGGDIVGGVVYRIEKKAVILDLYPYQMIRCWYYALLQRDSILLSFRLKDKNMSVLLKT